MRLNKKPPVVKLLGVNGSLVPYCNNVRNALGGDMLDPTGSLNDLQGISRSCPNK